MVTSKKTVLMLLTSKFQAQVWRAALTSQKISVFGGSPDTHVSQILKQFKKAKINLPDLLLTDFETHNPYDLCRWCRQYYPNLKIVLISNTRKTILKTERRWAIYQGADEFLAGFQSQNFLSSVIARVSRILEILDCPPLQEAALMTVLVSFCQEVTTPAQEKITLKQTNQIKNKNSLWEQNLGSEEYYSPAFFRNNKQEFSKSINSTSFSSILSPESTRFFSLSWLTTLLGIIAFLLSVGLVWWHETHPQSRLESSFPANQEDEATFFATTFQQVAGVPSGIFNYGGSTTWTSILGLVNPQIQMVYPDLKLRYLESMSDEPGSGTGIRMLLDGQLDFVLSSRSLKSEEYLIAQQRGFSLKQYLIAIDGIAVVVHPSLPISNLSISQLQQIYSGQLDNWSQVGGSNLAIVPFSRQPEASGTAKFFQDNILNQESFGSQVKYVYSTTDAVRQLNNTPGGIYFASAPQIVPQCTVKPLSIAIDSDQIVSPYQGALIPPQQCPRQRNRIDQKAFVEGDYPITRNLFVIVKQTGERERQIGEAYVRLLLSQQGQKLIEQAGFIPIQ